jgi:hypothetical protein
MVIDEDMEQTNKVTIEIEGVSSETQENEDIYDIDSPQQYFIDFKESIYDARWIGPLLGIVCGYMMFLFTTTYSKKTFHYTTIPEIRPLLLPHEIHIVKHNLQYANTTFYINQDTISLRHFQHVNQHGNFHLPELFYQGILFGISESTTQSFHYLQNKPYHSLTQYLYKHMQQLYPPPTSIYNRSSLHTNGYYETGYVIYYSYHDLLQHGLLSSDSMQPWKRIYERVKEMTIQLHIPYIMIWSCSNLGTDTNQDNQHRHIVQTIEPTRSGYQSLRHSHVVWLSEQNGHVPKKDVLVYQKPWIQGDHWTDYSIEEL